MLAKEGVIIRNCSKSVFRLDLRKNAFSNRVVNNWNMQSAQCVNACTINTFKKYVSVH